jgi:hypothetical protein
MSLLRRRVFSFTTFELILLALFAALIVVAKVVLRLPLRVPGHSGVFWMALVVVARGIVPKGGALTLVGLTSAILATFLGLGDQGPIDTFFSYLVLGVASDVTATFLRNVEHPVTATLVGLAGNSAKMLAKFALNVVLGIPAGFVAFGLLYAFTTNAIAGVVGGFLGWLVLVALRRAGFFAYLEEKR